MNCRFHKTSERGIALVITLVMLAIVTVMAIVFLGVSRRERASVKVMEDINTANYMADAALERAKAEAMAKMAAEGSKLHYDLFNSRSFDNPAGFDPSQGANSLPDADNVSYLDKNGQVLSGAPYLRMLANMQYDPRVPVFIETNSSGATDFRYYLDFDRNRQAETNGVVPLTDINGQQVTVNGQGQFVDLVGDPEWIGVLERPDLPHSETNRFIGRMAYLVLPAGKTLDLNYIHNANLNGANDFLSINNARNGYSRNEGVGSWEINLAAFFRELNPTNAWLRQTYNWVPGSGNLPTGGAFDDARSIVAFRYQNKRLLKDSVSALSLNPENPGNKNIFEWDGIDNYGDGPLPPANGQIFEPRSAKRAENVGVRPDVKSEPWPGAFNTNGFTDLQQLFNLTSLGVSSAGGLTNRLQAPLRLKDTFDRYQFYRMAAQLGVDSTPAVAGKLSLNFDNAVGKVTNTAVAWTDPTNAPLRFFTNAANLMLRASIDRTLTISNANQALFWGRQPGTYYLIGDTLVSTNFSIDNIQVVAPFHTNYPAVRQNEYTPTVHRILQVAANIYDSMTNRFRESSYPYFPSVFRPIYTKTRTNLYISGWQEVTNSSQLVLGWTMDLGEAFLTNRVPVDVPLTNINFFGEHLVIGAKKGHPNFNELALQSSTEIARKLEVVKGSVGGPPLLTNQMFLFSLQQRWGMEGWNSYSNAYSRDVALLGEVQSTIAIKDGTNAYQPPLQIWRTRASSVMPNVPQWPGFTNFQTTNFAVVLKTNFNLLQDVAYTRLNGFRQTNFAQFSQIEPTPKFVISTTNRVRYLAVDPNTKRVLDFVSFDNLITTMDLSQQLYAVPTASAGQFGGTNSGNNEDIYWDPTPVPGNLYMTRGITNQLAAAAGEIEVSDAVWKAFRFSDQGDKNGAISVWRKFLGLPLSATNRPVGPLADLRRQIPFVPSRRVEQLVSWQVNDPLVHYMARDIAPQKTTPYKRPILEPPGPGPWNIGQFNRDKYEPWGGSPFKQPDAKAYSVGVHDAGIRRSDDWEFPADDVPNVPYHFFANVGELGRVHRGTPWQTLYLKSVYTNVYSTSGALVGPLPGGDPNQFLLPGLQPTDWVRWSGSAGTHPINDWKLLDVFTTAANENATRGLLSVNQTNRAAWSAVLSGVILATNTVPNVQAFSYGPHEGADPTEAYRATYVEPATPEVAAIVNSVNLARQWQLDVTPNPNPAANPNAPWLFIPKLNPVTGKTNNVFERMGDVLGAPALTVQSPYLNTSAAQVKSVLTDEAMEYIPQKILSLLKRDEPRFVVYAFGQSLKPAAHSLTSDPNYFHMCTNYQITGEVMTKTVFRVEGDLPIPNDPTTRTNSLRAVVESYEVLPPE